MPQKISTLQEFENSLSQKIERQKWDEPMLEFVKALRQREKELEQAARERDKALADRDKALADIEARKSRDADAADRERVALAAELRVMREASDRAVAKDKDEVGKLQAQLDRLLVLKTEGEERHAATMAQYATAEADARSRVEALIGQETEIRGRLQALLGR